MNHLFMFIFFSIPILFFLPFERGILHASDLLSEMLSSLLIDHGRMLELCRGQASSLVDRDETVWPSSEITKEEIESLSGAELLPQVMFFETGCGLGSLLVGGEITLVLGY